MNAIEKKSNAINILIEKNFDKEVTDYSGKIFLITLIKQEMKISKN